MSAARARAVVLLLSRSLALGLAAGAAIAAATPAAADEPAPPAPPKEAVPAAPAPADATVGVVTGDAVNLRVGPRLDDAPVTQLAQGTVVVVVETAGEWLGVRVPAGFQAAIAAALVETVDEHHVRVARPGVNLRLRPPTAERAYPAFRDKAEQGAVLPVIVREGEWVWVEAPEEVRAYVHGDYVRTLGRLADRGAEVDKARAIRASRETARRESRRKETQGRDDEALRAETRAVALGLARVRAAGGYDRLPVVELADRLSSASEAHPNADARVRTLAKALQDDLEREIELRVAWSDEALARARTGRPPPDAPAPPAPRAEPVSVRAWLRAEKTKDGPAPLFVLWDGDVRPRYALRWPGGRLEDLDGLEVDVRGRTTGEVHHGLPVLEAEGVSRVGR
jgi:uncharacterized protein YgiM (DUF1202 family)